MNCETKPFEEGDEKYIDEKLEEDQYRHAPAVPGAEEEKLVYKITDAEGNIIAGSLLGIDPWKCGDLDILWVDERYRRRGLGSLLIRNAERVFRERGCYVSTLGTFSFQARPLYEKHGYAVWGTIENWPRGHANYSLYKRLDRPSRDYVPSKPLPEAEYPIQPGSKEDGELIVKGLVAHNDSFAPGVREEETLSRKLVDEEGKLVAGIRADIGDWDDLFLDIWVEEPYRGQGLGTRLLREVEREAREKGAYLALLWCFDWQAEFFRKRGYTVCSVGEDLPRGHTFCCLRKDF